MTDAAVARAKTRLTAGREEILARHRAGAGGQEVVRAISALTDELISELFQAIAAQVGGGDLPLSLPRFGSRRRRAERLTRKACRAARRLGFQAHEQPGIVDHTVMGVV